MLSKKVAGIDRSGCVACGTCIRICPRSAVSVHRGCYAVIEELSCVGCGKCAKECPAGCITIGERQERQ